MTWRVVLHRDRRIPDAVTMHLLNTWCATTMAEAARLVSEVRQSRSAEVATLSDVQEAEQLVVALQRRGLNATVRSV
jgi:hypothetical protein